MVGQRYAYLNMFTTGTVTDAPLARPQTSAYPQTAAPSLRTESCRLCCNSRLIVGFGGCGLSFFSSMSVSSMLVSRGNTWQGVFSHERRSLPGVCCGGGVRAYTAGYETSCPNGMTTRTRHFIFPQAVRSKRASGSPAIPRGDQN